MALIDGSWASPLVSAAAALTGVAITQRSARLSARDERLWQVRAGLYVDVMRWADEQTVALDSEEWGEIDLPLDQDATDDLYARVFAFASNGVETAFYMVRAGLSVSEEESRGALRILRAAVRHDLQGAAPPPRLLNRARARWALAGARVRRHLT